MTENPLVSYGWAMPSQAAQDMYKLPEEAPQYPDDCGRPHNWERFVSAGSCQCTACEEHREQWLECSECTTVWHYTNHFTWHQAWDKASWG